VQENERRQFELKKSALIKEIEDLGKFKQIAEGFENSNKVLYQEVDWLRWQMKDINHKYDNSQSELNNLKILNRLKEDEKKKKLKKLAMI